MKFWVAPYELQPLAPLNSRTSAACRSGALIRVELPGGASGYGDLHPWPEFGDAPLSEQLRSLISFCPLPLARRSWELACRDGKARAQGVSLFEGLTVPASHVIIPITAALNKGSLMQLRDNLFTHIKVKVSQQHLVGAKSALWQLVQHVADVGLRLRLDFNSSLEPGAMGEWLASGTPSDVESLWRCLDFIEDPCHYQQHHWEILQRMGFPLALDQEVLPSSEFSLRPFVARIVKPAKENPEPWHTFRETVSPTSQLRIVVTANMDHPLGQMAAAWEAARLAEDGVAINEVCGLLSHTVYETNLFSEALQVAGPRLLPLGGTGFGFDELLERQSWRER